MSAAADSLLEQALTLPLQERAKVAAELLASLDSEVSDVATLERLWTTETQRRADRLDAGQARTFTQREVFEGLARLRDQRTA
ncbi:MAG TPA: addiction module protein [Ilumatobacteraceae bacterium]|nr:addiction module protein [Ilumatobacteraceae bacterium]